MEQGKLAQLRQWFSDRSHYTLPGLALTAPFGLIGAQAAGMIMATDFVGGTMIAGASAGLVVAGAAASFTAFVGLEYAREGVRAAYGKCKEFILGDPSVEPASTRQPEKMNIMLSGKSTLAADASVPDHILIVGRPREVPIPDDVMRTLDGRGPEAQAAMVRYMREQGLANDSLAKTRDYLNTDIEGEPRELGSESDRRR